MKNEEFYLDNERFKINDFSGEHISLPVYQEKNNQKEEFNLVFEKTYDLVPLLWLSEVRYSLLNNKKQLIVLQVIYQPSEMISLDDEGRTIINPSLIKGGWQKADEWLSENYPTVGNCQHITYLDCSKKCLTGCLNLSNFPRLKEVNCSHNYLTELVIPEQAKDVNASSNNITSLGDLDINWETINLNLNNNPLNFDEVIATVKSLNQNAELERQEIERLKKELESCKKGIQTLKDNHKNNVQILKKEHQEQITAAQQTIQELDKKLTEKEQELINNNKKNNSNFTFNNNNDWWPKIKTPVIIVAILLVIVTIYYFGRKYLL